MEVELISISKLDWERITEFDRNRPVSRLIGTCYTTYSPMSYKVALGLPLSHIHASFAVRVDSASTLLFFSVEAHPVDGQDYCILTASISQWKMVLLENLEGAYDKLLLGHEERLQLAGIIWLNLELAGFRDIFIGYTKTPLAKGIFGI